MKVLAVIGLLSVIYSIADIVVLLTKQHYIRKLCMYHGSEEKSGQACVICCYHHDCSRAKKSNEYKWYCYCRKNLPDKAKELYDEIWEYERAQSAE